MAEIIITGLSGEAKTLPMTATKEEIVKTMLATCGHEDSLGYFANTPCGKCVRKAHRKATKG
jgi:hypothetical protein